MEQRANRIQDFEVNTGLQGPLHILFLEDNLCDVELIDFELREAGFDFISNLVEEKKSFLKALKKFSPDIILSDYDLPSFSGWEALQIRNKLCPDTPFILVTGALIEERAIEVLTNGATDYVLKHNLAKLSSAVHRALNEAGEHRKRKEAEAERDRLYKEMERLVEERTVELEKARLESEKRVKQLDEAAMEALPIAITQSEKKYRAIFENTGNATCIFEEDTTISLVNTEFENLFKYTREEIENKMSWTEFVQEKVRDRLMKYYPLRLNSSQKIPPKFDFEVVDRYGNIHDVYLTVAIIPGTKSSVASLTDISPLKELEKTRKKAEQDLLRNKEIYRDLFENAPIGMFQSTLEPGRYLRVNSAYARMLGYDSPEDLMSTLTDIAKLHANPEDRARVVDAMKKGGWYYAEYPRLRKDGSIMIGKVAMRGVLKADGTVAYHEGIVEDVTERNRAEEEKRKYMEEMTDLYENAPCGYHSLNADGTILRMNNTELKWLGYSRDEVIGKMNFEDIVTKKGVEKFRNNFPVFKKQGWIHLEFDFVRKDGDVFPVLLDATAINDKSGNFVMSRSTVFDNTERKNAEEALARSESLYRNLFMALSSMTFAVLLVNVDYRIEFVNQAFCEIFKINESPENLEGFTSNEMFEKTRSSFPNPDEALAHFRKIVKEDKLVYEEEVTLSGKRTFLLDYIPIKVKDQKYGRLWLLKEITLRKWAEEELRLQSTRLKEANKELDSFTYSVSHDLRAPLRAIDYFSRMLMMDLEGKLDTEAKNRLNFIRDNTIKMKSLIDDLLALSRVTRTELTRSKVDMNALAKSTWNALMDATPGIKVDLSITDLPDVIGNERLLYQVFSNLLSNAVKYTRKRKKALIKVGGEIKGQENVYYVKDNGAGFNMQYYEKLFGVFQRLHPESEFEGTGVGLAIVQRIIHRHGGRVWAEGKVGKGATFYFTLPNQAKSGS